MSVVSISSLPKDRETELEQVAELAVALSGRLTRLHVNEIGPAVAAALKQIAEVIGSRLLPADGVHRWIARA